MDKWTAVNRMIAPGQQRPGKWRQGVMQIWVTRACDKSCFGCTQGSNLAGKPQFITPEQFEQAVASLEGYFGVIGVFGGNPATHPQFETLCEILAQYVPFEQRGLWCNNPFDYGAVMRKTFNPAVSNLNVHLDQKAYDAFKRDWPESHPFGLREDSRHSPPYVAIRDVIDDESERWDLIADCDINRHWSAMICVFRGNVRAYFCEIAAAQAMLHQNDPRCPDLGMPVVPGWWRRPIGDFVEQIEFHCHRCGVPLRGYGELAQADEATGVEQTSITHAAVYRPKRPSRQLEIIQTREQLGPKQVERVIDYLSNGKK